MSSVFLTALDNLEFLKALPKLVGYHSHIILAVDLTVDVQIALEVKNITAPRFFSWTRENLADNPNR